MRHFLTVSLSSSLKGLIMLPNINFKKLPFSTVTTNDIFLLFFWGWGKKRKGDNTNFSCSVKKSTLTWS